MQKNYCVDVDYQLKLVRCKHVGVIRMKEISAAKIEAFQTAISHGDAYNLLIDCREVDYEFQVGYSNKLWAFLEEKKDLLKGRLEAIIINKPLACAYAMLYKDECERRKFPFRVALFSTEEAAMWWLVVHQGHK